MKEGYYLKRIIPTTRPGFRHGQGVRPHRGIHQFGASTKQNKNNKNN